MNRGLFVTGTDTGIGKTFVSTGLLIGLRRAGLRAAGMKPVASGCEQDAAGHRVNADALALQAASADEWDYATINPYAFAEPIAPHIAAAREQRIIEPEVIVAAYDRLARASDRVIVEGVGGWRVPFAQAFAARELVQRLDLPVLLVVGFRLGCINHALLSAEALQADGVRIAGWVANHVSADYGTRLETLQTLGRLLPAPLLAEIPPAAGTDNACWQRLAAHMSSDEMIP